MVVSRVVEKTRGAFEFIPHVLANHKLMVALAMLGRREIKLKQVVQQPILTLESFKGRASCTSSQAAALLQITTRSIRDLAAKNTLTRTETGRIVFNEKFHAEFNRRHAPREN
jgi:hypothetical protein